MSDLEEYYKTEELPLALVIAGLKEIEAHGLADFSLRRVATSCGVSCAAPYRHFKSKNELILAVIEYVNLRWELLSEQILQSFASDTRRAIIEFCLANIRFWTANPNFRHIMLIDDSELDENQRKERAGIYKPLSELVSRFCREKEASGSEAAQMLFLARSAIYGATQMLGSGEITNTENSYKMIRSCLELIIS